MNEESNNVDFEKTRKTLDKSLIIELILRGGGIVSCGNHAHSWLSILHVRTIYSSAVQVLALSSIISSSVCLNKLLLDTSVIIIPGQPHRPVYIYVLLEKLLGMNSQVFSDTRAAAGWILFLSLVVFMYQFFAIFQLFVYLKLLYIKIPVGKSLWYLFPLIVSGVHTILCADVKIIITYNRILLSA